MRVPENKWLYDSRTFSSVGKCIYCGDIPVDARVLSQEHIIPLALGGRLILPSASCHECRDITAETERICLREFLAPMRAIYDIKSPKRKHAPKPKFKMIHDHLFPNEKSAFDQAVGDAYGNIDPNTVKETQSPPVMLCPIFQPPGMLENAQPSNTITIKSIRALFRNGATLPKNTLFFTKYDHSAFFRLLSKIAYGYAVAILGMGTFRPFILDTILGHPNFTEYYVGGFGDKEPVLTETNLLHKLYLDIKPYGDRRLVFVTICLFSYMKFPMHQAIVGEML